MADGVDAGNRLGHPGCVGQVDPAQVGGGGQVSGGVGAVGGG